MVPPNKNVECLNTCEILDDLPPYNVSIVYVNSYYADKEMSIDFLSRLGNVEPLDQHAHYFSQQDCDVHEYLKSLSAVVYEHDLNHLYVFLSDLFVYSEDCQQLLDFEMISKIQGLQSIFLGSLLPLQKSEDIQAFNMAPQKQLIKMRNFLRSQMEHRSMLIVYRMNSKSYVMSETFIAKGFKRDEDSQNQDPAELSEADDVFAYLTQMKASDERMNYLMLS